MKGYQKLLVAGMVTLLTVGLVGCTDGSDIDPNKSPGPSINPPNVTISPIPTAGNEVVLKDLDNKDVALSSFQGKRVLMVFWNMECFACKKELPILQELNDAKMENLVILAVTNKDSGSIDLVKKYVTEQKFSYQFLYDETGKTQDKYGVKLVPHTVLLDAKGSVDYNKEGEMTKEDYLKILNSTPDPTIVPTEKPTPTVKPTPTIEPTVLPSMKPTPSKKPKPSPTVNPTLEPTLKPSPIPSVKPSVVPGANDFTLQDINGKNVSLVDYRGKKVLLVFWGSGCGPCITELPAIQKLKDKNLTDVVILTICYSSLDSIKEKVKNYNFITLYDKNSQVFGQYNVKGTPTNIYLDRQGKIYKTQVGSDSDVNSYVAVLNNIP